MSRKISDVLRVFRLAIGRRNPNDPDSNDGTLLQYINDFMSLTMSDDFHIFEQFRTLTMTIDSLTDDGVFEFPSTETSVNFVNISSEIMISLLAPAGSSVSWYPLRLSQDPGDFYSFWGINNEDILIPGAPTEILYHGNEFVFRTIPDQTYQVKFYGYEKVAEPASTTANLPYDYWMRFVAYGAAKQYAADYRLDNEAIANIERNYVRERRLLLTRTHNQIKLSRPTPRF